MITQTPNFIQRGEIKKMFEETVNKIGAIIALILGIAAIIILVGCIVVGLIFVIKESKEKRKSKDTASKAFIKKRRIFQIKRN